MNEITFETLPQAVFQVASKLDRILNLLEATNKPHPEPDGWLNLDELCSYLPSKPSKATVYGWTQAKKIPYHKNSKSLAFRKSEIDSWLSSSRIKTNAEIENEANNYLRRRG